jgi:hypothetical protein
MKKKQGEALGKSRVLNLNTRSKLKRLLFAVTSDRVHIEFRQLECFVIQYMPL